MVAFAILAGHVGSGIVALFVGFAALFAPKGMILHRAFGSVFTLAMAVNGASAAWLGYATGDANDVVGGTMTVYLVATAWMAARRRDGESGWFEKAAFLFAAFGAAAAFAVAAKTQQTGAQHSGPAFLFAAVVAYAALLDLNMVLRKGLSGRHRIARHLWRMSLALFVAAGSFFLGQMDLLPAAWRRIELLCAPVLLVLLTMVFWLVRVRFARWPAQGAVREKIPASVEPSEALSVLRHG